MKIVAAKKTHTALMIATELECPHCKREVVHRSTELKAINKDPFLMMQFEKTCKGCNKKFLIEYYP